MLAPTSPSNSNYPSQVHLVFPASNDRGVFQQAMPVQQSHMSPMPIDVERRMLQQAMPVQQSPFPAMPMQAGIHAMRPAPINSYSSPAFHMPTISQQVMPMQQWSVSPMPVQQAPWNTETAKRKLQAAPSCEQIQTFQQRAWSSKRFQIHLHEWVGEMKKKDWIDGNEKQILCHRIHQRDPGFIAMIIDIRDYEETMTDQALGLTWTSSDKSPAPGTEIKNELLAKALYGLHFQQGFLKFSPEEWKALKVTELFKNESYIKIVDRQNANRYFYNFKQADKESMKQVLKEVCNKNSCIKITQGITPESAGAADVKPFLSARLRFKRTSRKKSAHFLQVPCIMDEDIFNVQLVRYFVENVWKLERPDVIISVTGSADNFDLPPEHTAMLMRGMMEGTRKLQTWFITGGTKAGIMKDVGEARAKYNPSAPLIGVTSLCATAGGLQLRRMLQGAKNEVVDPAVLKRSPMLQEIPERCKEETLEKLELPTYREHEPHRAFQQDLSGDWIEFSSEKPIEGSVMSYDDLVHMDEASAKKNLKRTDKGKDNPKPLLDSNHSHFILVDDGSEEFGTDRDFRAAFESYVANGDQEWLELSKKFHRMDVGRGNAEAPTTSDSDLPIPVVSVCVQGGPGTVDTVLKACQSGTSAAFLVRGSGKAADLLSDAVRLQYTPSHSAHVSWLNFDTKQDAFWKFLRLCGVDPRGEYKETQNLYDGGKAIKYIKETQRNLYDWDNAIKYIESNQTDQHLLKNAGELVRTIYKLVATNSSTTNEKCLKIIVDSLRVALKQKCWVYDLQPTEPGSDDFNLALLKCVLNGIAPVGQETAEQLKQKLKLSMIWSCDYIIDYILERMPEKIDETTKRNVLDDALVFALKEQNVHAVTSLIHRGTGMQMLDVGDGFCYVKDFFNFCDSKGVVFTVTMPYTKEAFDTGKQKQFTAAMASTAGISPDEVFIPSIECDEDTKNQIKVETKLLAANSASAQALVSRLGSGIDLKAKIDAQLTKKDLKTSTNVDPRLATPISELSKESIKKHFVKFCEGDAANSSNDSKGLPTIISHPSWHPYQSSLQQMTAAQPMPSPHILSVSPPQYNTPNVPNGMTDTTNVPVASIVYGRAFGNGQQQQEQQQQHITTSSLTKKTSAETAADEIIALFDESKKDSKDHILKCGLSRLHLKVLQDAAKSSDEDPRDSKDRSRYFHAASKWTDLIDQAKKQNPDFVVMWEKAENLRSQTMQEDHNHEHEPEWEKKNMKTYEEYKQDCLQAAHPIPEHLRLQVYQYHSRQKSACQDILQILETDGIDKKPFYSLKQSIEKQKKRVTNMMNLLLLEGLYVDLCGPAFRYRMGILGDQWFDMFFWYVLQNQKDLASVMWEHVKYPVRSAICAAYLLRRMVKNKNIDPLERDKMLENSHFFDEQATNVQRAAEDDDENRELAAESLDCELFLWRGISLMDLAVQGECEIFLKTESFKRSVHSRLFGDLSPDGNDMLWRQIKLILSALFLWLAYILRGFFAWFSGYFCRKDSAASSSGFLEWTPPPRSEVVRHSTQRRDIPKGYPHHPSRNEKLKNLQVKERKQNDLTRVSREARFSREIRLTGLLKKRDNETKDLTSHQLETLWAPTFGKWQRWVCFMSAPYVLFLLNCLVAVGVTIFFTVWFIWMRLQPLSFPDKHDNNMTGHEIFLMVYFVGCLIREIAQLGVSICKCHGGCDTTLKGIKGVIFLFYKGCEDYFNDNWNVPELLGLIFFFVGFGWRLECTKKSGGCKYDFDSKNHTIWLSFSVKDSPIETYHLFYGLSLFFNWIRVLRCLYLTDLGLTIGIFFSMTKDILKWLSLYAIVLVAISMLFVGTSDENALVPGYKACSNSALLSGDDLPENGYIACSFSYVFFRPMLQSFGNFSLKEMTNVYSFIFLLATYFFLNLVLINLLIATMSSTYSTVSAKAEHWKLLYEYELVQEHARRSIAFPPPLNVLALILDLIYFCINTKNVRRIYPDYTWCQRIERFFARNTSIGPDSRVRGATHSSQDHGFDRKIQADIAVFEERARRTVMNKGHSKGSLEDRLENVEGKLDSISKDAKIIQDMQQASNRGSTRARMLDKRALYANTNSGT